MEFELETNKRTAKDVLEYLFDYGDYGECIWTDFYFKNVSKYLWSILNIELPLLEKNNIVLSARQNKANPPTVYFSANICNAIPILIECWLKGRLNIKIIAHHEAIVPLVKEVLDKILN